MNHQMQLHVNQNFDILYNQNLIYSTEFVNYNSTLFVYSRAKSCFKNV